MSPLDIGKYFEEKARNGFKIIECPNDKNPLSPYDYKVEKNNEVYHIQNFYAYCPVCRSSIRIKERGFEIIYILIVAHGGNHNDTICTVEKKINKTMGDFLSPKGESLIEIK